MLTWVSCFTEARSADTSAQTAASAVVVAVAVDAVGDGALLAEVAAEPHPTTRQHVAAAITRQPSLGIAASTAVSYPVQPQRKHHVTTSDEHVAGLVTGTKGDGACSR
jgi:hypothetical protein